jgi:N6-adenosine-specific RNA methylase IME4
MDIVIDGRIKSHLPKLTDESFRQLELNVMRDGCLDPLVLWVDHNGRNVLIDGHNRYSICQRHNIPFKHVHIAFDTVEQVIEWIEDFQAGRRNLPPDWFSYYLGQKYEREKKAHGGAREASPQNEDLKKTSEKVAAEYGVSKATVERAAVFAKDVEAIADKVGDSARTAILDGELKATRADVHEVAEAVKDEGLTFSTAKEAFDWVKQQRQEKAEAKRAERIDRLVHISAGNSELPTSVKYPVIYADPPWQYEHMVSVSREIENKYPTMALEEICALPVGDIATEDAILFMWTTAPHLEKAFEVIRSWGFSYRSNAVWDKQKMGMGYYFRTQHEILLIATRGEMVTPAASDRVSSVFSIPRGEHSAKPVEFYNIIEKYYPELPKIELFCRSPRDGWSVWGNQSEAAE